MSLVVSSTTDTQEQVNAAAGIAPPEAPPAPPAEDAGKPAPEYEPEAEDDGEEETPEGEQPEAKPEDTQPKPKRAGGFQRRIERLEREKEFYALRLQEIEHRARAGQAPPPPQQQERQQPDGPPRQDQFESYEDWIDKLTDYKLEQAQRKQAAAEQQRAMAAAQQETLSGWQKNVGQFRNQVEDFEEVLASVDHVNLNPVLQQAILRDAKGPQLAYELARQPEKFAEIAALDPLGALTALGEFKAGLAAKQAPPAAAAAKPVSRAPAPIRPVGQGASTSTVPPDQLPYRDYVKWRERNIAAARAKR